MSTSKLEQCQPRLLKHLGNSKFVHDIIQVANQVEPLLERIPETFPNYTLHNVDHSIRIMEYMFDLVEDINKLSELEIAILIYSALLHDIGMYVTSDDIDLIKNNKYTLSDDSYEAMLKYYNNQENLALQNYVRKIHAERSAEFINAKLKDKLFIPSLSASNFTEEIVLICTAHTKDISWLRKLKSNGEKGTYHYNSLYCALLLRLADIIDIDSQRTPPLLYEMLILDSISTDEWKQHFIIENMGKVKYDEIGKQKYIVLFGKCNDASIHRKILSYIDWINFEIRNCITLSNEMNCEYQLKLDTEVKNNIITEGFSFSHLKLNMNFKAITELLMGERIYGERKLGLRELIQNSIDACKVRKEIEDSKREFGDDEYIPTIRVILDREKNKVTVKDNGKGMSMDILKNCFLNVGISYYKSNDFLFKGYSYKPIGNFGIGFLAAFMLSSNVIVKTRHFDESIRYDISLTSGSEYICLEEQEDVIFQGTEVILIYSEFMKVMGNEDSLHKFLSTYFLTDGIKLELRQVDKKQTDVICNSVIQQIASNNKTLFIDLDKYLINIDGYISVEVKRNICGKSIEDIPASGDVYFYDGSTLIEIDPDTFEISNLYNDDFSIKYIEIPIVHDDEIYNKAYEVLEDKEEAIDKISKNLEWITIFYDNNNYFSPFDSVVSLGDYIIGYLRFEDIVKFGQSRYAPTKVHYRIFRNYYDQHQKLFLPFKEKEEGSYYFFIDRSPRQIYVRNVLIKNAEVRLLNYLSSISVKEIKANIYNENIMTDLSRNSLTIESKQLINYAFSKSIHLWALENLKLSFEEKTVFEGYLRTFFYESNILMKS